MYLSQREQEDTCPFILSIWHIYSTNRIFRSSIQKTKYRLSSIIISLIKIGCKNAVPWELWFCIGRSPHRPSFCSRICTLWTSSWADDGPGDLFFKNSDFEKKTREISILSMSPRKIYNFLLEMQKKYRRFFHEINQKLTDSLQWKTSLVLGRPVSGTM